jgi:hypothetical protein
LARAFTVAASLDGSVSLDGTVSLDGSVSLGGGSGFSAGRLCGVHVAHRNNRRDPRAQTAGLRQQPACTPPGERASLSSADWRNTVNVSLTTPGAAGPQLR